MEAVYIAHCWNLIGSPWQYRVEDIDVVTSALSTAISSLGIDLAATLSDQTVLVKLNLVRAHNVLSFTTDLRVVEALLRLLKDAGAGKVCVGDNSTVDAHTGQIADQIGVVEIAKQYGADFIAFEDHQEVLVRNESANLLREFRIPKVAHDCDVIINVPKLKTHTLTQVSLAIKNHHGLIAKSDRLRYHRDDINEKLLDIYAYFADKEILQIIDGLWAVEGQGPCDQGKQVRDFNCLVVGSNAIAVDTVGAALMGFNPREVPAVRIGNWRRLGPGTLDQIRLLGTPLHSVQGHFKRPICAVAGMYEGVQAFEFSPCRGCVGHAMVSLDIMSDLSELQQLPSNLVIVLGAPPDEFVPNWDSADVWLVGECTISAYDKFSESGNVYKVEGCPPWLADLRNALRNTYQIA